MHIRPRIVFGCAAKEVLLAGKTEFELLQPGNEQLLAKKIWSHL